MSRSPSKHAWHRHWLRVRNGRPRHLLYVNAQGAVGWASDNAAAFDVADSVSAWCAAHPDSDIRLAVSGELIHSLVVDPAVALRGADAVRDHARQQFTHYHGSQAAAWPLAVWSEPGRGGRGGQAGACAAHGIDLAAIQTDARRHGVRLRSVAPVWSTGLRSLGRWLPRFEGTGHHALLLVEAAAATWLVAEEGRIVTLSQRYLDVTRSDAVAALLDNLLAESPPLAGLPVVIGWGTDAATAVPPGMALMPGPLGAPMRDEWMRDAVASGVPTSGAKRDRGAGGNP